MEVILQNITYKCIRKPIEKIISSHSLIGNYHIFNPKNFEWTKNLEENWHSIKEEVLFLIDKNLIPNELDLFPRDAELAHITQWKTYFLYAFGQRINSNCNRCPNTDKVLKNIPNMKSALFSVLKARKNLPAHRGYFNAVLRYHLGIIIPTPNRLCGLRVENDVLHWEEGKSLIFDDTFDHEAWNNSNDDRIVLMIDFIRPLPKFLSNIIKICYFLLSKTRHVKNAVKKMEHFSQKSE